MNSKIQKIELLILFIISIISLAGFYLGNDFSDNAYQISSDSHSVGFFSYYASSLVVYVSNYTGLWSLIAFAFFVICYSFIYAKRDFVIDSLICIPLCAACLFTSYVCFPFLVGESLRVLFDVRIGVIMAFGLAFISFLGFFAGTFRAKMKDKILSSLKKTASTPSMFLIWKQKITHRDPTKKYREAKKERKFSISKIKEKIATILKGNRKVKEVKPKFENVLLEEQDSSFNEKIGSDDPELFAQKDVLSDSENNSSDEIEENIVECPDEDNESEIDEVPDSDSSEDKNDTEDKSKVNEQKLLRIKRKLQNDMPMKEYENLASCIKKNSGAIQPKVPDSYFGQIISVIEGKLLEFGIQASIVNIMKGPVVDTFELELGPGVKVSKVSNRSDDLSLALKGMPIRIIYPIPGKTTVGIEVPRNPREMIYLDELLNVGEFTSDTKELPIAMGKDAYGDLLVVDLAKMPHMLVAGATGTGKSVFINAVLISLLVKRNPKDLKLILIDPKQLELALYANLPHLAMPVVTDHKMAAISLLWACQEMERRYSILKEFGVRNLAGFNQKLKNATPQEIAAIHDKYEGQAEQDGYKLPHLVIIIDEFADLMLSKSGKEIEINVNRLAAKARAAGIHLIVATQRPSVQVITGNIKSNFPSRVSFKVISGVDSRTILDSQGAEKLLKDGDMLFYQGINVKRAHGAYVSDSQVEDLVGQLSRYSCNFIPEALSFLENGGDDDDDIGDVKVSVPSGIDKLDNRYDDALEIAISKGQVSASMLQRTMGIGYPKAAKIVDQMERNGVVGPANGSKPRDVLIRK